MHIHKGRDKDIKCLIQSVFVGTSIGGFDLPRKRWREFEMILPDAEAGED